MTEAERLQKIIETQASEIRRLRRTLAIARTATVDIESTPNSLQIVCTTVGCDEYHFIEQVRAELVKLIESISNEKGIDTGATESESGGEVDSVAMALPAELAIPVDEEASRG